MTNVLAILILSSGFSGAVEVNGGFVEQSFANTPAGVKQFLDWSEPLIVREAKPVKICTVAPTDNPGEIMQWLLHNNMGPALLSPAAFEDYVQKSSSPPDSASSAARACLTAFPFIRSAK